MPMGLNPGNYTLPKFTRQFSNDGFFDSTAVNSSIETSNYVVT